MAINTFETSERLLQIEAESGMFDLEVNGVRLWQYIRVQCLVLMIEDISGVALSVQSYPSKKKNNKDKINLREWINTNQFFLKKKDLIVINTPRRVKDGKYYICPITDTLLKNLDYSYYVFESEYNGMHYKPVPTKNLKYMDFKLICKLLRLKSINSVEIVRPFVDRLFHIIVDEYNISLSTKCKKKVFDFAVQGYEAIRIMKIWSAIVLNLIRPSVILANWPHNDITYTLFAEAKKRGIITIELQHGISYNHVENNILYKGKLDVYPDYIFTFSEFDRMIPRYPIPKENVISVGYPNFEKKVIAYERKREKRKEKVLLVISGGKGGYIGDKLIDCALELRKCSELQNVKIIYKLHPKEYNNWKRRYPVLENSGMDIIADNSHDIYYYLAKSDFVLGISSTVLYEATEFDTNIFILKEGNYEDSHILYENGFAELVDDADAVMDRIVHPEKLIVKKKGYFERNSIGNIKRELERIMLHK